MIPRFRPPIRSRDVLRALAVWERDAVEAFETAFARLVGQRHALAFAYGRAGLALLLDALGVRGREVLVPAYTCVVVPHAVTYSGNTPVFVDSVEPDANMDLVRCGDAVTERTGAVVATSIFGHPVDIDALNRLRLRHPGVHVIQDCAHSFDARWDGRPVQTCGAASLFALNVSKLTSSVFGGMVCTDDAALYARLRQVRDARLARGGWGRSLGRLAYLLCVLPAFHPALAGLVDRLERGGRLGGLTRYYDDARIDMPADYLAGLTPLEARVGLAGLAHYRARMEVRQRAARYYFRELSGVRGCTLPPCMDGATYSHFAMRVRQRDHWLESARRAGVQLGSVIDYSIPEMPAYGASPPEAFPVAARWARSTVNLPLWTADERVLGRVCDVVRACAKRFGHE